MLEMMPPDEVLGALISTFVHSRATREGAARTFLISAREQIVSTKTTLKYECDPATGEQFHLYRDWPDEDCVILELEGFAFESAAWVTSTGVNKTRIEIRITDRWARKLGLIGDEPA
jgi:hypothetical protein